MKKFVLSIMAVLMALMMISCQVEDEPEVEYPESVPYYFAANEEITIDWIDALKTGMGTYFSICYDEETNKFYSEHNIYIVENVYNNSQMRATVNAQSNFSEFTFEGATFDRSKYVPNNVVVFGTDDGGRNYVYYNKMMYR